MKKLLILVLVFSMGLAGIVSAERGKMIYYRWDNGNTATTIQQYQRDFSQAVTSTDTGFAGRTGSPVLSTPSWENGTNYAGRFQGWILPPETGNYIFSVCSDDNSELWLSPDRNASGAVRICNVTGWTNQDEWTKEANQTSAAVALVKDKPYFFYAVWKEGGGGDGCAVGWKNDVSITATTVVPMADVSNNPIVEMTTVPGMVEYQLWNVAGNGAGALPTDFSTLGAPAETGTLPTFGIGSARVGTDNFTYRQYGIIKVPADCILQFGTTSDDGSKLYVGNWWDATPVLTKVVDNDGLHGGQWRYGSKAVSAGYVGIVAEMFEQGGGEALQVNYGSDTIPWQQIPMTSLYSRTAACIPSPLPGATGVAVDALLSWSKPAFKPAVTNLVYLGESGSALAKVYEGTATTFDPAIAADKIYAWRVDISEPNAIPGGKPKITTGQTWGFMTTTSAISITTQPVPTAVDLGAAAKLSVVATSGMPLSYQWYKGGVLIGGATSPDLNFASVGSGDLGSYYCVVSNAAPVTVQSRTVMLAVKKQVAYYPFEGNAKDMSGSGHDGTIIKVPGDPNVPAGFVAGVKGQAIQFNGLTQYVNAGTWDPSADSGQLGLSMWARWEPTAATTGDQWQGLIGKREGWSGTQTFWQIEMSFDGNNRHFPFLNGLAQYSASTGTVEGDMGSYVGIERTVGGTATASAQNTPNEGVAQAFDNNRGTKWLCFTNAPCWIAYDFAGENAYLISKYSLTSGNDAGERDPLDWRLEGTNDGGTTWTTVDSRTNATNPFTGRQQTLVFDVTTPGSYKMYRLYITRINGTQALTQLMELQLFEVVAQPSDMWKWVHVAATFDGVTSKLFINGQQRLSSTGFVLGPKSDALFGIGTCEVHADGTYGNRFLGSVDEVKLYNYALSNTEIAQAFVDGGGAGFCVANPQYDFNGNCTVDIADLMMFMSQWLQCNEVGPNACK
jgi:hypothetical protein